MNAEQQLEQLADQFVTQGQVLERMKWLTSRRLAKLRRDGLRFARGKGDEFVYRVADLDAAIGGILTCENDNGNTAVGGSDKSPDQTDITSSGTTGDLDEPAAARLAQRI